MDTVDRLLSESEPWLQYAVKINLLGERKEDLKDLKSIVLDDEKIQTMLKDIDDYHGILVNSHKNANLPIHQLLFLLDLGLDRSVPEIDRAINAILSHKDENGVYQSLINVPKHFGGSGEDTFGWALCDAPLLLYALIEAEIDYDKHIKQGVDHLASLSIDSGYPCAVSRELGTFRGPGKKSDCCPYATLWMLKLFSKIPEYRNSLLADAALNCILDLWENSMQTHPYMFYMGTDFRKLKAPSLWYDILSVTDALSRFDQVQEDKRFQEMIAIIKNKQDENNFFTPESIYRKFKDWDFGQKKVPSPYLTYLCLKIFRQIEHNSNHS